MRHHPVRKSSSGFIGTLFLLISSVIAVIAGTVLGFVYLLNFAPAIRANEAEANNWQKRDAAFVPGFERRILYPDETFIIEPETVATSGWENKLQQIALEGPQVVEISLSELNGWSETIKRRSDEKRQNSDFAWDALKFSKTEEDSVRVRTRFALPKNDFMCVASSVFTERDGELFWKIDQVNAARFGDLELSLPEVVAKLDQLNERHDLEWLKALSAFFSRVEKTEIKGDLVVFYLI